MSKYIKMLAVFGLVGVISACGSTEEEVFVEVEPVSEEPAFTGKYK